MEELGKRGKIKFRKACAVGKEENLFRLLS